MGGGLQVEIERGEVKMYVYKNTSLQGVLVIKAVSDGAGNLDLFCIMHDYANCNYWWQRGVVF